MSTFDGDSEGAKMSFKDDMSYIDYLSLDNAHRRVKRLNPISSVVGQYSIINSLTLARWNS